MDSAFLTMCKTIDRMDIEWNKTKTGAAPTASVVNLWKEGQKMHTFLRSYRKDTTEEFNKIINRFAGSYRDRQEQEYRERIASANEEVVKGFRDDVSKFVADKTEKLDVMITTPPTENQRALLDSLKMRGKNLSRSEALRILPIFYGNYEALKAFEAICKDAGYKVYLPMENAIDLYSILEEFESYMNHIANQIGSAEPDFVARSFFFTSDDPSYIEPAMAKFSQAFDSVPQLQNYSMDKLTAAEQARINSLFRGIESLDPDKFSDMIKIADRTQKIIADNKDDLEMILRSPYGKYVQMSFDLEKAKLDAMAESQNENKQSDRIHGSEAPLRT